MSPARHDKRIEIRWRDLDAFGHVNNAVYLNYFEEARDEWLNRAVTNAGSAWDFVLARVAVDFRVELVESDGYVMASCELVRIGRSSVVTREQVRRLDGTLSAEAESVLVARDTETRGSRPLTATERAAFERRLPAAVEADGTRP